MRSELKEDMSTLSQALLLEAYLLAAPEHLKVAILFGVMIVVFVVSSGLKETEAVPKHPQIYQ